MFPADWNALMTSLLPYKQETNCCIQASFWGWVGGGHWVSAGAWVARGHRHLWPWRHKSTAPEQAVWGWAGGSQGSHGSGSLYKTIATGQAWAQHVSQGWDWNHDSAHGAHSASVCCSRVLCWMHPGDSRNLGDSMVPIRDLVATGIWCPEKVFQMPNHRNTNLYSLCKLILMTKYMTVRRHLLLTLWSAHLDFYLFSTQSANSEKAYYIAAFQSRLLSLALHWWRK